MGKPDVSASGACVRVASAGVAEEFEEAVEVDVVGHEFVDDGDFVGVLWLCLDGHGVNGGGDVVAVFAAEGDWDLGSPEEFHEFGVGQDVACEEQAGDGWFAGQPAAGHGGEDDVVAVAGGDDEDAWLHKVYDAFGGHGTDDDAVNALAFAIFFSADPSGAGFVDDLPEVGGGEGLALRDDTEEGDAESFQAFASEIADHVDFVNADFIEDSADDFDAVSIEMAFVKSDFVNRSSDAAGGDEDSFGAEELGDLCIGEVANGADACVAAAFDDDGILFVSGAVEGTADFVNESGAVNFAVEVAPGELAFEGDGAHGLDRDIDIEGVIEQKGIFVNLNTVHFNQALADGLDVADFGKAGLEHAEEAETGSGFAFVLPRGGDEQAHDIVVERSLLERDTLARFEDEVAVAACFFHENSIGLDLGEGVVVGGDIRGGFAAVEEVAFDSLGGDDNGGAEDVDGVSSAADFGAWLDQAGDDLPVAAGAGDDLNHFGNDIAAVEVGEHQDIGFSGHRSAGNAFLLSGEIDQRGINLQLAVYFDGDAHSLGLFACFEGGEADALDAFGQARDAFVGEFGGGARQVTEQGDPRQLVGKVGGDIGSGHGDIGQLVGGWFRDDPAIGEKEDSFDAEFGVVLIKDEHGGATADMLLARDNLKEGSECAGGGAGGAGNKGVGPSGDEHHGGKILSAQEEFAVILDVEAAEAGQFLHHGEEQFKIFTAFGLNDANAIEPDI